MLETGLTHIDISKKYIDNRETQYFLHMIRNISRLNICLGVYGLSRFIVVNGVVIKRWVEAKLLFPKKMLVPCKKTGENIVRELFEYKDIARAFVIKYLSSKLGIYGLDGIRVYLETVALLNRYANNESKKILNNPEINIDDIEIDKFLIRTLCINVENMVRKNIVLKDIRKEKIARRKKKRDLKDDLIK